MSTIINATTTNGVVIQPDNSGSLVLQTNSGTTALTIDTAQNATFAAQATIPTINLTGGQIVFPATQSASANANTLDDYEEGTWTPSSWTGGGSSLTYTGAYVKVGKQVTVYFKIGGTGVTSTAAVSTLSGLPFAPSSTPSSDFYMGVCMNGQTTNGGVVQAYSDSKIYFAVSIASTVSITGTITYFV